MYQATIMNLKKKTIRTFIGRKKIWFEFPVLFMFLDSQSSQRFKITYNSTRIIDAVHNTIFFRLEELLQLQCFLNETMKNITCTSFLKPSPEKQEISLGHQVWVSSLFLFGLGSQGWPGRGKRSANQTYTCAIFLHSFPFKHIGTSCPKFKNANK